MKKSLHLKWALRSALLVLLMGAAKVYAQNYDYDFSANCSSGQTLYYKITSDTTVKVTYPWKVSLGGGSFDYWHNHVRPTGDICIPESVMNNGINYSVTLIGDHAFWCCSGLSSVTIPNSVKWIYSEAFISCTNLSRVNISDLASWCNIEFYGDSSNPLAYAHNLYVNDSVVQELLIIPEGVLYISAAFIGATNIRTVIIPNSVTRIGSKAFLGCSSLESINIPNSVTQIGSQAFSMCSSLESINIPNSVTRIDSQAFSWCSSLESITIPNSITYIGDEAFMNCQALTSVTIPESVKWLSQAAFSYCSSLAAVDYNAINCDISSPIFQHCNNLTSLSIGGSVQSLSQKLWADCPSINKIFINDIASWCNIVFDGPLFSSEIKPYLNGSLLTELCIPEGVDSISSGAFNGAVCLRSLSLSSTLRKIGSCAFNGCSGLSGNLDLPETLTIIREQAFGGCSGFTGALVIPNSVTYIGSNAFFDCSGFSGPLIIPDSVLEIGVGAFGNCTGLTSVTIGKNVERIIQNDYFITNYGLHVSTCGTFEGCTEIACVNFNAINCTDMHGFYGNGGYHYAFSNCPSLKTLNIGDEVQTIPGDAFRSCSKLNTVVSFCTIPPTLGANAFSNISSVAALFVPCGSQMAYFSSWNIFNYNNIHEDCTPRPVLVDSNVTGGTITPSVSEASMGQEVTLTVSPNPLMEMVSVTAYNTNSPSQLIPISPVDGTAVPTYKFIMPMFGVTISATFEHSSVYLVNVSQDIVGGSVTASTSEALAGETVELEVNPDYGYNLLQLSVCNYNDPSQTVTVTNRTFVMPSFDVMVSATFKKTIFSISISPGITGGTVSTSVSEQRAGKPVTIEALPNYGYELRSLTVANVNDPAQTVDVITASSIGGVGFIMPSFDVMVSAEFVYTSVDESEINPISVYPNPTSGVVKIEAENLRHISVFNVLGQNVYEEQVDGDELEINLSGCEPGVYLIRIETASGVTTKQVVVTK